MLTSTQIGELAAQFFIAGVGTLCFAVLFACPRKSLFFCGLVGAVGWFVYELAVMLGADSAAASLLAVSYTHLVTFNGSSTAKPLVASLAAEKGILVSVLSADTRDLSGQCYGSMLLKLPADVEQAKQAAAYMRAQPGITVEEVTGE